jgi:hypothetical protein
MAKDTRSPKPTVEDIMTIYQLRSASGTEARIRVLANQFRLLCRLGHDVDIPAQYKAITKVIKTPYIRDAWLRATAALNAKPPLVHIEGNDITQPSRDAAAIAERWDMAAWTTMDKITGEDSCYESSRALIRDGESVLKVVHRPDSWAVYPRREKKESADEYNARFDKFKKGRLPFAWRLVDRLSMVFGDGEFGDDWCIEYGDYPRPELGQRYGMVTGSDGKLVTPESVLGGRPGASGEPSSVSGTTTKIEYWTADWWCVVVDGQMAPDYPKENPYSPRLPYFRAKGSDSESLLYSMLFLVPGLDRLLTMKQNWAYLGSYPTPVLEPVPNFQGGSVDMPTGDDGQPPKVKLVIGKVFIPPQGYRLSYLVPPPMGQDVNQLISVFTGLIEIAGIPAVMRGAMGANSGYEYNQAMAAASMAFKVAGNSLQRQFEGAFEFIHWCITNLIKQSVYVLASDKDSHHWLGLKPTGSVTSSEAPVDMLGPLSITFRPTLPTDEQARAMIANQLVNAPKPLMSRRHALERYLQEEDPDAIIDEIWVEQAMEQEPLRSKIMDEALREAGLAPQPQPQPAQAQAGQPMMPPGPGELVPGVPGQAAAGIPSVPGVNMPMQPGRPAGAYPGQPGTPSSTM